MELSDVDTDVLAERILRDLKNTLEKDPLINEFDVLPIKFVSNKSPVIHIDHKLALESWCVRHLYLYVYTKFTKWKQHRNKINPSLLLNWTSTILLINPNIETVWNIRKELIRSAQHSSKDELKFTEIVLSRKPKCNPAFAHRKGILLDLVKNSVSHGTVEQLIEKELCLCTQTSNKYASNYYSWSHRIWVIEKIACFCLKVILKELNVTQQWASTHISDHSGFHYRQFLLQNIIRNSSPLCSFCPLQERCRIGKSEYASSCTDGFSNETTKPTEDYRNLLMNELNFLSGLQLSFPGHETLWNHRRFIVHSIINFHICAKTSFLINKCPVLPNQPRDTSHKKCKFESECCMVKFFWNSTTEENFILSCLQNTKDNAWEINLIGRHQKWLERLDMPN